jgi:hypothetical protein
MAFLLKQASGRFSVEKLRKRLLIVRSVSKPREAEQKFFWFFFFKKRTSFLKTLNPLPPDAHRAVTTVPA